MSNRGRHKKSNKHLVIQILGSTIANRMMECQREQGNKPNLDYFLTNPTGGRATGGFIWSNTKEGFTFWEKRLADCLRIHPLYKQYKNDRS